MQKDRHSKGADPNRTQKKPKPGKSRLDVLLVERGLAPSRERAQALLLAGQVRLEGLTAAKAGALVPVTAQLEIIGEPQRYASRGGLKLEGALNDFGLSPANRACLDVGSSTGGFTDCLLQRGAKKVYAIDVTTSQLDWRLQQDSRVAPIRRNARHLQPGDIPESAAFLTMDLSFISVTKVVPAVVPLAAPGADFLILIKPQFELKKNQIGKGGIVRDPDLHKEAVEHVASAVRSAGLRVIGIRPSHITGAEGNQEFFLHARLIPVE